MIYGYARVSTSEQETTLQIDALKRAGAQVIYEEKASSVGTRPKLRQVLSILTAQDELVFYKLDRLARNLKDLLQIIEQIEAIGCGFRSLTEVIDTTSPAGRLMLNVLGSVAEFERSLIRQRSMAGQASARDRGVRLGRPRSVPVEVEADILAMHSQGCYTLATLALIFDCHPSTVKRVVYRVTKPGHSSLK